MGLAKTGKFKTEKQNYTVETACQALINKTNGDTPIERYVTFLDAAVSLNKKWKARIMCTLSLLFH